MEILTYWQIIYRQKWIVLLTAAITFGVIAFGISRMAPQYTATTTLRVLTIRGGSREFVNFDVDYADRLMKTAVEIANSDPVRSALRRQLGQSVLPAIKVEIIPTTELLKITVKEDDPVMAAYTANALGLILVDQGNDLYNDGIAPGDQASIVSIIDPAQTPSSPSSPNMPLYLGLGAVISLAGGLGLALALGSLDTRLHTGEAIEAATDLPIRGRIPTARKYHIFAPDSIQAEAFQRLGMTLLSTAQHTDDLSRIKGIGLFYARRFYEAGIRTYGQLATMSPDEVRTCLGKINQPVTAIQTWIRQSQSLTTGSNGSTSHTRSLLVTSAAPGDGKSTIAANLSVALSQTENFVLCIDMDLIAPTLHTLFGLPNEVGLSSVLEKSVKLRTAVQATGFERLAVLTSGPFRANRHELFASGTMQRLIKDCLRSYDIVVIDCPAVLGIADATLITGWVDDVLFVVRQGHSRRTDVTSALDQLRQTHSNLVGVVVNRTHITHRSYYHHYHQHSRNHERAKAPPSAAARAPLEDEQDTVPVPTPFEEQDWLEEESLTRT